ncbi:MAG: PaaI family thioesterase [Candidatus Dormibacteria bacterium]
MSRDTEWLNDRSDYQVNFVHGLRNPHGLHLEYALDGDSVVTTWTPTADHAGFPGLVHGGLVAAVLDDIMGRCSVLEKRWVVTGRIEVRFRAPATVGTPLRAEAWTTRTTRRLLVAQGRVVAAGGEVVAEASGTYLPVPSTMIADMVRSWPGFSEFIGVE